ncbi:MAG TPA: sigma-70 family RNA polymerase sigma factor [Planctomycetaceae bacterium]|nr:sigma-70 family RNA polymerase sigma factor [Planctomycetaceae bacterium]
MILSVWRILRNADDADDAIQDALTTVWRQWGRLCRHSNPQALLLRICIDAACDRLRRRSRQLRVDGSHSKMRALTNSGASQQLEQQETETEILQAIAMLPGKQCVATYMRLVEGHSYEAIAAALGCGEPSARKHVARGRQRLQSTIAHLAPTQTKDIKP